MHRPSAQWTRLPAVAALALLMAPVAPAGDIAPAAAPVPGSPESFLVRIGEPATAGAVRHALEGAFERLSDDRCASVLDEFRDGSGAPLSSRLSAIAPTPEEALTRLFFYDGSNRPECRDRRAQASTQPGSRVVLVCGLTFFHERTRKPERTEIWLIHEMLHSLGLRENPPSSEEITRIVSQRCLSLD